MQLRGVHDMISDNLLLSFSVKNFRSFAEEVILDLTAAIIREHADTLISKNGINILPLAAIFGANASGKSNLFSALHSMKRKIKETEEDNLEMNSRIPSTNTYIAPYIFSDENLKSPTIYEVCINVGNIEYRYGFSCNKISVLAEWLYSRPFSRKSKSDERIIFERGSKLTIGTLRPSQKTEIEYCYSVLASNQLLINAIGRRKKVCFHKIYEWFNDIQIMNCSSDTTEYLNLRWGAKFLYENKQLLQEVSKFINLVDPSILEIEVKLEKDENYNDEYKFISFHKKTDGTKMTIPFELESSGTKKILALSIDFILSLQVGGVLAIDELDAKLHPLIIRRIIQMFSDRNINIGNAQLIFSAHNLICLDSSDLRRDEIWFVEKNEQKSNLFSLYDFKDYNDNTVRSDLSFGKHYLAGRFGAIPFMSEGGDNE